MKPWQVILLILLHASAQARKMLQKAAPLSPLEGMGDSPDEVFDKLDTDQDDGVSEQELFSGWTGTFDSKRLLLALDKDGDGVISRTEFSALGSAAESKEAEEDGRPTEVPTSMQESSERAAATKGLSINGEGLTLAKSTEIKIDLNVASEGATPAAAGAKTLVAEEDASAASEQPPPHDATLQDQPTVAVTLEAKHESEAKHRSQEIASSVEVFRTSPPDSQAQQGFECSTGPGRSCRVCRPTHSRTTDDQCEECNNGYRLVGGSCEPYKCDLSPLSNCLSCKPTHARTADDQCTDCKPGYAPSADLKCVAIGCQEGVDCKVCRPQHLRTLTAQCEVCNHGFVHNDDFTCRPHLCSLAEIPGCHACQPLTMRTGENQCQVCRPGFRMTHDFQCEPIACRTGSFDACKTCMPKPLRTALDQCDTCNGGYALTKDHKCRPYVCVVGTSTNCAHCEEPEFRTQDQQCVRCDQGYQLSNGACRAYTCVESSKHYCRVCMQQHSRTRDSQCAQCNDGYELQADQSCQPIGCTLGSGSKCLECQEQERRTGPDQCTKCNPGYGLVNSTCKPFTCSIGPGPGCRACKVQMAATDFGQCAACNSGYKLMPDSRCDPEPTAAPIVQESSDVVLDTKQVLKDFMKQMETNLDSYISKALTASTTKGPVAVSLLRGGGSGPGGSSALGLFGAADTNADGALSRAEFKALEQRTRER